MPFCYLCQEDNTNEGTLCARCSKNVCIKCVRGTIGDGYTVCGACMKNPDKEHVNEPELLIGKDGVDFEKKPPTMFKGECRSSRKRKQKKGHEAKQEVRTMNGFISLFLLCNIYIITT